MHRLSSSTPPRESAKHERAIAALAQQSHVLFDHVAQLYECELAVLTARARITDFLTILTTRKVREILRQRRQPARTSEVPAPRSEERGTVIAVCAWCSPLRCEGGNIRPSGISTQCGLFTIFARV